MTGATCTSREDIYSKPKSLLSGDFESLMEINNVDNYDALLSVAGKAGEAKDVRPNVICNPVTLCTLSWDKVAGYE